MRQRQRSARRASASEARVSCAAEDERQRRKHRQDVRRQLGAGQAEEHEHEQRPGEAELRPREAVGRDARVAPAARKRPSADEEPGQESRQQQRHEVVPAALAAMLGGQEALEVLVDEEELREFRIARATPARTTARSARGRAPIPATACSRFHGPVSRVASEYRTERRAGNDQPDQALGQRRAGRRRIGEQHPVALRRLATGRRAARAGTRTAPPRDRASARCRASATATARSATRLPPAPAPRTRPSTGPSRRAAVKPTITTASRPASAGTRRAVHSCTPNALNAAAVAQYCSGGFSKYLRPFRRGVTQSPRDRHFARDLRVPALVGMLQLAHARCPRTRPQAARRRRATKRSGEGTQAFRQVSREWRTLGEKAPHSTLRRCRRRTAAAACAAPPSQVASGAVLA